MNKRIGIIGGTFDPVHNGHLYLARKMLSILHLDKIFFVPSYLPPHKKDIKIIPARHRLNMVKLAIRNNKRFEVSNIEIKRKGTSYSVITLKYFRRIYGPRAEIFFIAGSDLLSELHKWKDLKKIFELCRFVVVERPGFKIKKTFKNLIIKRIDAMDISATQIRRMLKKGEDVKGLLPPEVIRYINRHHLYVDT